MDALAIVDDKLHEGRVTVQPATVIRDERQTRDRDRAQPLDQIGFGGARKRRNRMIPDRGSVFRALGPDRSRQPRSGRDLRAAQELLRLHRLLAGALHFEEPHRALAAGNRQAIVQHRAGRARALAARRAQHLDRAGPASSNQAPGNGDSPRQWSCTAFHGFAQSMRVSLLSILAA